MINVKFFVLNSGEIVGFDILGHSGYSEIGTDIVCAAVSSAAYMAVNTLTEVVKVPVDVIVRDEGQMRAVIDSKNVKLCSDILKGFKLHLQSLEETYPKNIKVSYAEVQQC